MKIINETKTQNSVPFEDLVTGDIFRLAGEECVYEKTDVAAWNALVLTNGQLVEISQHTRVIELEAQLTYTEK